MIYRTIVMASIVGAAAINLSTPPPGQGTSAPARNLKAPQMQRLAQTRRSALQTGALSAATLSCFGPCLCCPKPAFAAAEPLPLAKFPGSLYSKEVEEATHKTLEARGYNKANTLFACSTCPDEVNYNDKDILDLMNKRWGETFHLGGLAGVPFSGKAGLYACATHVPDEGKFFICFAPHVSVGEEGKVGELERTGVASLSYACGASLGAFKALKKGPPPTAFNDEDNLQIDYIQMKLAPKLGGYEDATDDIAFITYKMYEVVRDAILTEIKAVPGIWDHASEVAVLGGVQINQFSDADMFQPLFFQTTNKQGGTIDLYERTFGPKPDVTNIMGSVAQSRSLYSKSL